MDALHHAKVEWDDKDITIQGVKRPCENFKDQEGLHIHCNQSVYASAMKNYDAETEYKMIAHEYFSLAGLEPNSYGLSDYPFSSQISAKLQLIEVKRWAVKSPLKKGFQCEITRATETQSWTLKFQSFDHQSRFILDHLIEKKGGTEGHDDLINLDQTEYHTDPSMVSQDAINLNFKKYLGEDLRHASSSIKLSDGKMLQVNAFVFANTAFQDFSISLDGKELELNDAHCIPIDFNSTDRDPFFIKNGHEYESELFPHSQDFFLSLIRNLSEPEEKVSNKNVKKTIKKVIYILQSISSCPMQAFHNPESVAVERACENALYNKAINLMNDSGELSMYVKNVEDARKRHGRFNDSQTPFGSVYEWKDGSEESKIEGVSHQIERMVAVLRHLKNTL